MTQMTVPDRSATAPARLATRLSFLAGGFAISCWAPLIPFAKNSVGADEALLGILLLCLGMGSVVAMPLTGIISARRGARPMILLGGFGMGLTLPFLALAGHPVSLGATLFVFGAALGTLDVAMNVHAAEVERTEARPLMSGFHAQFSIGGFAGAGSMTALLSFGLSPILAALIGSALTLGAMALAAPRLLRARGGDPDPFVFPRGLVLLLAVLAAVAFLVEGAILDWGALLLIEREMTEARSAGLGYMLFSVAMVAGRLSGDWTVARLGEGPILVGGGILTMAGLAVCLLAATPAITLAGFVLVGLGAANLVPVVFSIAGRQTIMPAGLAIASVTTTGYAGVLLGPAIVGFAAHQTSLPTAFWVLALMMAIYPLTAGIARRG